MTEGYATPPAGGETLPHQEAERKEASDVTTRILTWAIILLVLVVLIAAAVFLVMGVMALIAVVSPILVAGMLAWLVFLSVRVIRLEKRLSEVERPPTT